MHDFNLRDLGNKKSQPKPTVLTVPKWAAALLFAAGFIIGKFADNVTLFH